MTLSDIIFVQDGYNIVYKKIIIASILVSFLASGFVFAQTSSGGSDATLKQIVSYATGKLNELHSKIQGRKWKSFIPKNARVEVVVGSGDAAEKYNLEVQGLKITTSGVGAATRPGFRATVDTKQSLNDLLSYKLGLGKALDSGQLKITGVGFFNKIKLGIALKARKFLEK